MSAHIFNSKHTNFGIFLFSLNILFQTIAASATGTWTPVIRLAPNNNEGVMILLTDGSVMVKTSYGASDAYGVAWNKLTPDINGSYANGTWTLLSYMNDSRLYFSTQMLKNGNVYVAGGEYGTGKAKGEVYYPGLDTWVPTPALPILTDTFEDANSQLLPDGRVLQAVVISGTTVSKHIYIYDPVANTYTPGPATLGVDDEATWLKLPDNSILFVDIHSLFSERYIPATNAWITDANLPVQLYDAYGYEAGPAFLLPDGRAFFIGATNATAYYTPSGNTSHGSWTAGPIIPDSMGAPDAAGAIMANGKILCAFSHVPVVDSIFQVPTTFYEFDYLTNAFTKITAPDGRDTMPKPSYFTNMLCLPDGSILYGTQYSDQYYIYTPDGTPLASGKPTIDSIVITNCDTFLATGTLFNGISQGACYGDDWQMATNYPIIRLSRNDTVYYASTYNWNSTGIMRGTALDSVQFVLPPGLPDGDYWLRVIANGIASDSVLFRGCSILSSKNVAKANSTIKIFPNPANDMAAVVFTSRTGGEYTIRLLDMYGRTVLERSETGIQGENTYMLHLGRIAKGTYSVIIRDGNGVYSKKLVVK